MNCTSQPFSIISFLQSVENTKLDAMMKEVKQQLDAKMWTALDSNLLRAKMLVHHLTNLLHAIDLQLL